MQEVLDRIADFEEFCNSDVCEGLFYMSFSRVHPPSDVQTNKETFERLSKGQEVVVNVFSSTEYPYKEHFDYKGIRFLHLINAEEARKRGLGLCPECHRKAKGCDES